MTTSVFELTELPVCLDSHPSSSLLACGCVDGSLLLLSHTLPSDQSEPVLVEKNCLKHKQAVRAAKFGLDGSDVIVVTRNKALCRWDLERNKKLRCFQKAHPEASPYALALINQHQVASGDESGCVRMWDWRRAEPEPVAEWCENEDYITGMVVDSAGRYLLATSGDSVLSAFDVRKRTLLVQSEPMQELLSCCLANGESKTLCGGADGFIEVFNHKEWGNISDRLDSGHGDTVDCLVALRGQGQESLVVSGSAEGSIRLHHIQPNQALGVIGEVKEGVEAMCLSSSGDWLFASGLGGRISSLNVTKLTEDVPGTSSGKRLKLWKKQTKTLSKNNSFFDDLANDSN